MKKIAPIAAFVLLGAMFTSCKKDYTCTCKDKDGKQVGQYTYPKAKKKDAKAACDVWHNGMATAGGKCEIN